MEIDEKNLEKILDRQKKEFQEVVDEKFEQRTEKIIVEQRKEFERHIGALKEDFSSQLQGVADSVSGANQKLDSVMEMVAKNTEDIDVMKGSMNLMQSDIGELKEDVGVLKEDMGVVKSDISTIKFDLKNKVDLDEFQSLGKRVLFLERKTSHA
jgi:hypothetical protein